MSNHYDFADRVALVTGGASGIGAALARRFKADGAANVIVVDLDLAAAQAVADEVDGVAERVDVTEALTLFRVTPDQPPAERPWFTPGQYCVLGMNNAEKPELGSVRRSMSMRRCCSPCPAGWTPWCSARPRFWVS